MKKPFTSQNSSAIGIQSLYRGNFQSCKFLNEVWHSIDDVRKFRKSTTFFSQGLKLLIFKKYIALSVTVKWSKLEIVLFTRFVLSRLTKLNGESRWPVAVVPPWTFKLYGRKSLVCFCIKQECHFECGLVLSLFF